MEFRRVLFRSVFCGSTVMPQTGSNTRPSGVPSSCPPWLPQQPWPPECALCFDSVINRLLPSHNYLRLDTTLESRSEERRVGKECVRPCRSRESTYQSKKNTKQREMRYPNYI